MNTVVDDIDVQEDVIAGLVEQGYSRRNAEGAMRSTFRSGQQFSDAFRDALALLTRARSTGKLRASDASDFESSSNGVAGRARVAGVSPAESTATLGGIQSEKTRVDEGPARAQVTESSAALPSRANNRAVAAAARSKTETHVETKICGHAGCGKKLKASNQSGFCTEHWYDSKRKTAGDAAPVHHAKRKPKAKPRKETPLSSRHEMTPRTTAKHAAESPAMRQTNTAQISEYELDQLWARLPLATKMRMLFSRETEPV